VHPGGHGPEVPWDLPGRRAAAVPGLAFVLFALSDSPFPLSPGTWWEYRESYTEHIGSLDSTTDDSTRFEVRGTAARPFIHQSGGVDPVSAPLEEGEGWIRLEVWTGEEALPLPLEVGASGPVGEGEKEPWRVEAAEDTTVPAGTFHALRCALRTPRNVSILWIAPEVGVVREIQGAPDARPDIERVLLRWQPGPK
jgi:hypothetical protein